MTDNRKIEIDLFIEGLFRGFGYDFREYNRNHVERRILKFIENENIASVSMLQHKMFHEPGYFDKMIRYFSVNVTAFFRDEHFFKTFRKEVIPHLKSFPKIKIWHAGCSTGQEVYSIAILLEEAGLLNRAHLYGTDFNSDVLVKARRASYSKEDYEEFISSYRKCGGELSPDKYFQHKDDMYTLSPHLKEKVSFHHHNLTTDHILGEMTVVICRNVLIYFSRPLQDKVFKLFDESIKRGGMLCLGAQETIHQSGIEHKYSKKFNASKIYMKNYVRGY